jgi:tRNA(Ile)-lysidine synthase
VLAELLPKERLVVAHFDHAVRPESAEDARFVAETARGLRIASVLARGPGDRADEAALRMLRWSFLETVARDHGADTIATAHHAGDQLETLLLRLLRGTGPRGLAGIRERDGLRWRPWLSVPPSAIDAFAKARGLRWREDATNADTRYARNALRHRVLPALFEESLRHGGVDAFLGRVASACEATAALVDERDRSVLDRIEAVETPFFFRVASERWSDETTVESVSVRLGHPILREQRARATAALRSGARRGTWGNGLEWHRSCGFDYVTTPAMRLARAAWAEAAGPALAAGRETPGPLRWQARESTADGTWRLPRPGDRKGTDKLKRFWLERRVPAPERGLFPVLARDNRVLRTPFDEPGNLVENAGFPFAVSL